MKKPILFFIIVTTFFPPNFVSSHVKHYGNLKYLEYEIYLNNDLLDHMFFILKKIR